MVDVEEDNGTYCTSDACRHKGDNYCWCPHIVKIKQIAYYYYIQDLEISTD
jgi:hypothetical protein